MDSFMLSKAELFLKFKTHGIETKDREFRIYNLVWNEEQKAEDLVAAVKAYEEKESIDEQKERSCYNMGPTDWLHTPTFEKKVAADPFFKKTEVVDLTKKKKKEVSIELENSPETMATHKWIINGSNIRSSNKNEHYKYMNCSFKNEGCTAQIKWFFNRLFDQHEAVLDENHGHHQHPEILQPKEKSWEDDIAQNRRTHRPATSVFRAQNFDSNKLEDKPKTLKQIQNKQYYEKKKTLPTDEIGALKENNWIPFVAIKPFMAILVNIIAIGIVYARLAVDTTFEILENGLYVSTILGILSDGTIIPIVHCLSEQKNSLMYGTMFKVYKHLTKKKPKEIISDFDWAIRSQVRLEFPESKDLGDRFHLFQACLGFARKNVKNLSESHLLLVLNDLVYALDSTQFDEKYVIFMEELSEYEEFLTYFYDTWIKLNPPHLWSTGFGHDPTDSNIESWHHVLKSVLLQHKLRNQMIEVVGILINNFKFVNEIQVERNNSAIKSKLRDILPKKQKLERNKIVVEGRAKDTPTFFKYVLDAATYNVPLKVTYKSESNIPDLRTMLNVKWINSPFKFSAFYAEKGEQRIWSTGAITYVDIEHHNTMMTPIWNKLKEIPVPPLKEPIINEPVVNEPIINEPIINEPIINESEKVVSDSNGPIINEPIINEPIINEPDTGSKKVEELDDVIDITKEDSNECDNQLTTDTQTEKVGMDHSGCAELIDGVIDCTIDIEPAKPFEETLEYRMKVLTPEDKPLFSKKRKYTCISGRKTYSPAKYSAFEK